MSSAEPNTNAASAKSDAGLPLSGMRALDLTDHRGELGPWLLGELGVDVIRVEPPHGTDSRRQGPFVAGDDSDLRSLQFCAYNSNKRSIALDLTSPDDTATFLDLVTTADFVFDSGVPGSLAEAGISHDDLVAARPDIVHVQVTPYGADGPRATAPATELTISAFGGAATLQGTADRAPVKTSVPQVWRHAGGEAAVAAMVAHQRMVTAGGAQFVDVSAQSAMTWTLLNAMEAHDIQGADFARDGAVAAGAVRMLLRFPTSDGYCIAITRGAAVAALLDWMIEDGAVDESWRDIDWETIDARIMDGEGAELSFDEIWDGLARWFAMHPKDHLMRKCLPTGVTVAPINNVEDLLGLDHLEHRDFWTPIRVDDDRAVNSPGTHITLGGVRPSAHRQPPHIGEHTAEILAELAAGTGTASPANPAADPTAGSDGQPAALPFDGIKVADFSWVGVGPITAKSLADHGATVIRVENHDRPDVLRLNPPFRDNQPGLDRSQFFGAFNTSKRSLDIDLKTDGGMDIARRLIEWADVVIDSWTPGAMARLGLGPDDVAAVNPSAITVTTSLLASGGPLSHMAGYGYHAAALAGFYEVVGWADLPPDGPWFAYTDTIAPRFLATSLMAALDRRRRTGEGAHIEMAQLETGLHFLAPELLDYQLSGHIATRNGNRDDGLAPQGVYPCVGDDRWLAISVPDDTVWKALVAEMDAPDWAADPSLEQLEGRLAAHDQIDRHLSEWTAGHEPHELAERLIDAGVPAAVLQRSSDLLADPQYAHRRFYARHEHAEMGETPYAGHQYRIAGYEHGPRFAAPAIGQHTFELLTDELGFDAEDVADLAARGALG